MFHGISADTLLHGFKYIASHPPKSEKQPLMLFMHPFFKHALLPKYFCLGKPVVSSGMSGSEMIANILLTFMPVGI